MSAVHPVRVWRPEEVRDHLATFGRRGESALVAVGQWPTEVNGGWADRVGILDVSGRPEVLIDAWVRRELLTELSAILPGSFTGGWDVMFATSWRWAWGGTPLSVWSKRGLMASVIGRGRAVVRRPWSGEREHAVRQVVGEVSKSWAVRRVGLRTATGDTLWIARQTELGALIDPTYDGLNLLADAGWASALGSALAGALGVPFETNDIALR